MKSHSPLLNEAPLSMAESKGMAVASGLNSPSPVTPPQSQGAVVSLSPDTERNGKDLSLCFDIPSAALQI